jgi:hypothetical protein
MYKVSVSEYSTAQIRLSCLVYLLAYLIIFLYLDGNSLIPVRIWHSSVKPSFTPPFVSSAIVIYPLFLFFSLVTPTPVS